jgi:hypothetical protein
MYILAFILVSSENFVFTESLVKATKVRDARTQRKAAFGNKRSFPDNAPRSSIFRSSPLFLHLISLFSAAVLGHRTGNGKTLEKQVTTIA